MKLLFDYNQTLYNPKTDTLFPGVLEVLEALSQDHELYLITLNRPGRSSSKHIQQIQKYFQAVHFVERKTAQLFETVIGDSPALVIGDNIGDELGVGHRLGIPTVLVEHESTGSFYNLKPTHTIKTMKELVAVVAGYQKKSH